MCYFVANIELFKNTIPFFKQKSGGCCHPRSIKSLSKLGTCRNLYFSEHTLPICECYHSEVLSTYDRIIEKICSP